MTAREKLLELQDVYDHKGSSDIFMEAMRDCIKHHISNNNFFKQYLSKEGFDPDTLISEEDLKNIPFIRAPAQPDKKARCFSMKIQTISEIQ